MKTAKIKNIAVCGVFFALLFGLLAITLLTPDKAISEAERRKLHQMPELSIKAVFSAKYSSDFESYALDQFAFRDSFRTAKALASYKLFGRLDSNGLYVVDNTIYKTEYPLNEQQVLVGANKLNSIMDKYLTENNRVFYSIVPDKSFFAAGESGHLAMDYDKLVSIMNENVAGMEYIDIFGCLTAADYYRTDTHWRQEKLQAVVDKLAGQMGFADRLSPLSEYTAHTMTDFKGVYYGQAALPLDGEELVYLTSPVIDASTVYNLEKNETTSVYNEQHYSNVDPYDIYLSGAAAFLEITNPNAATDRELVIFRDSFGSSIAPLLIEGYAKVTLIDLRYMSSALLSQFVTFTDQDVLFLYSTSVLNSASMLR